MSKKQQKPAAAKAAPKPAPKAQGPAAGWADVADPVEPTEIPSWPAEAGEPVPELKPEPLHQNKIGFRGTARGGWPIEDGGPVILAHSTRAHVSVEEDA